MPELQPKEQPKKEVPKEAPKEPQTSIKPEPKQGDVSTGKRGNWKVVSVDLADNTGKVRVENLETYEILFISYENKKWFYQLLNKDNKKVNISSPNFEKLLNAIIKIYDDGGKVVDKANEQIVHGSQERTGGKIKARQVYYRIGNASPGETKRLLVPKNYSEYRDVLPHMKRNVMNGYDFAELLLKDKSVKLKGNEAIFSDDSLAKIDKYILNYYNFLKDLLSGKLKDTIKTRLPGWEVVIEGVNKMKKSELRRLIREIIKENKEFIVWGIPPNKKDEEILFTKAKSYPEAKNICDTLEKKHGCKKCRVQTLDLSNEPNFKNIFN